MNLSQQPNSLKLVSILWALLAVACFLYFTRSRNAPLKRQLWPYYNVVLGGFVVAVAILMRFPLSWIVALVPLAVLIAFMNFRSTRFCMSRNATLRGGASFTWHARG